MDGNKRMPGPGNKKQKDTQEGDLDDAVSSNVVSVEHLQHLVRVLDASDVSEIELRRPEEGTHLILRKARAPESNNQQIAAAPAESLPMQTLKPEETKHNVTSPLVGTFHVWARPKGGALVAIGDRVKAGQLVGTVESLNMFNEVETSVTGRVLEILAQEGQPVEYGQLLMIIDSAEGV